MKLKFTPNPSLATGIDALRSVNAVNIGYIATDSNGTDLQFFENTAVNVMLERGTGIMIDPTKIWKKYFDLKKYSASLQCKW